MPADQPAFQDVLLPAEKSICWICGHSNPHGLQIKSYWDGEEAICNWDPQPHFTAYPNVMNGGIIASLIDCHCINTAMMTGYQAEEREPGSEPHIVYVTGELKVRYLQATPMDAPVTLRARVTTVDGRKTSVGCSLYSQGEECARGDVLAVRVEL
jgi:acyl-coenzyme A thioesterase PaaI-like protein